VNLDTIGPAVGLVPAEMLTEAQRLRARRLWLAVNQAESIHRTNELRRQAQAVRATLTAMSQD
jgi:hypothetical protein